MNFIKKLPTVLLLIALLCACKKQANEIVAEKENIVQCSAPTLEEVKEKFEECTKTGKCDELWKLLKECSTRNLKKACQLKTLWGRTPLHYAVEKGHTETAKLILKKCPRACELKTFFGRTPLHHAVEKGYTDIIGLILEKCPSAYKLKDDTGRTPLHLAAEKGYTGIVELILEKCPKAYKLKDAAGRMPQQIAAGLKTSLLTEDFRLFFSRA